MQDGDTERVCWSETLSIVFLRACVIKGRFDEMRAGAVERE